MPIAFYAILMDVFILLMIMKVLQSFLFILFTGISTCITSVTFIYYYLMQAKCSCFYMKRKRISYITSVMKRKRIKWKIINHMASLASLACVYVCSIHFRFCSVAINRDKSTIVCVITMILSIVEINFLL